MKIKNYWLHLKTIVKHKWYVFNACRDCGITWRGIKHDLSKLSMIEFKEYAENYTVGRSPVDVCKEKYGYCKSWQHHKGRNTHHWHHWIDVVDCKAVPLKMPYADVVELICDWIGAGKAYNQEKWTEKEPWNYWCKNRDKMLLHTNTYYFINRVMWHIKESGWYGVSSWLKHRQLEY